MKSIKRDKGFATLEILLIIIVLAILASGVWVWKNRKLMVLNFPSPTSRVIITPPLTSAVTPETIKAEFTTNIPVPPNASLKSIQKVDEGIKAEYILPENSDPSIYDDLRNELTNNGWDIVGEKKWWQFWDIGAKRDNVRVRITVGSAVAQHQYQNMVIVEFIEEMSDWNNYSNKELNFEMKYPKSFSIQENYAEYPFNNEIRSITLKNREDEELNITIGVTPLAFWPTDPYYIDYLKETIQIDDKYFNLLLRLAYFPNQVGCFDNEVCSDRLNLSDYREAALLGYFENEEDNLILTSSLWRPNQINEIQAFEKIKQVVSTIKTIDKSKGIKSLKTLLENLR